MIKCCKQTKQYQKHLFDKPKMTTFAVKCVRCSSSNSGDVSEATENEGLILGIDDRSDALVLLMSDPDIDLIDAFRLKTYFESLSICASICAFEKTITKPNKYA